MVNVIPLDHVDDVPVVEPNQNDDVPVVPDLVLVDKDEDLEEEEFEEEEEPQEEEDMDIDDEEDDNEPELIYPYEEVDPLNPSSPASESKPEDMIEDRDGLLPGLMRRDINSLFGQMASLSRRLCGRETAHALLKMKGKEKDEYYGKLILDLGNEVCLVKDINKGTKSKQNRTKPTTKRKAWKSQKSTKVNKKSTTTISCADPTLLNDFKMATEGNGDPPVRDLRTMKELCQPYLNGRGGLIASIAIQAMYFGLKNDMIQQVQNSCQFHGLLGDDANKHLDKFLHVTQSIKVNGVIDDALRLYHFLHSLTHHATAWFDRGTFMKRRPKECYDLIKNMTAHHNDWDTSSQRSVDNRPPMLEKDMYDSWKSRMELYMLNRPHGRMILESVEQGPLIWPFVEVEGVTRLKKYSELSAAEAIQADCEVKATNIILQGLPPEVYALVNDLLTAELERYKSQERVLNELKHDEKASTSYEHSQEIESLKHTLFEYLKEKESFEKKITILEDDLQKEESINIDRELALEKEVKELNNIMFKRNQSAQTVHMLTKPQVFYNHATRQALGFQNPRYLKKAQQLKPNLYDGSVIGKSNVIVVPDSENTLMQAEESRSKMIAK
uniref:Reverse transcriptase domain-containing protein n=1 Tax=Tanacetum cinerariifolium TaxID=118510 RepID=A0A6L2JFC3_TANCI|nr:reverse transcriptase domain-containing protein [Tanacetum cinerariifolium]